MIIIIIIILLFLLKLLLLSLLLLGIDGVSSPSYETKDYSYRNSLVPDLESPQLSDYPLLLMGCLRLLLEGNSKNATVFRECGGARCAHNMVPNPGSRADALRIIHELILSGGNDDLSKKLFVFSY